MSKRIICKYCQSVCKGDCYCEGAIETRKIKREKMEIRKKEKYIENRKRLKQHNIKSMISRFKRYGINITPWEIWKILKKQRMRCALSGIPLIRGDISIDHIIPKSCGGTHDKINLRFVSKDVNRMKGSKLDGQFFDICKKILEHQKII